nr:hypothetical protein [uncultured Flavobacterium sp.]
MKLRKHPFFQKNKSFKYFLLVHLVISLIAFIFQLVHGCLEGNALKSISKPYQNYKALNNPEKYLKSDFFILDTAFVEQKKSSAGTTTTHSDYTVIKGRLLNSKIEKEITIQGNSLAAFYIKKYAVNNSSKLVYAKKNKSVKVVKNKLNDEIFLEDKNVLQDEKCNAIIGLYFQFSLIFLIIILFTLKKESEIK